MNHTQHQINPGFPYMRNMAAQRPQSISETLRFLQYFTKDGLLEVNGSKKVWACFMQVHNV